MPVMVPQEWLERKSIEGSKAVRGILEEMVKVDGAKPFKLGFFQRSGRILRLGSANGRAARHL